MPDLWYVTLSIYSVVPFSLFRFAMEILLGVWGPVITSVGNLLTIVLVLFSDVLLGGATDIITVWSLIGAGVIVAAFGVLAYDMFSA
jgi:hypothetical protein